MGAEAVYLTGLHAGHEQVPIVILPIYDRIDGNHARGPGIVGAIEEDQFDTGSASREDAEIHACGINSRTQRIRSTMHGRRLLCNTHNSPAAEQFFCEQHDPVRVESKLPLE